MYNNELATLVVFYKHQNLKEKSSNKMGLFSLIQIMQVRLLKS